MTSRVEPASTRLDLAIFDHINITTLTLLTVAINLPYLSSHFVPSHDTKIVLAAFIDYYSHFFHESALPRWLPYGQYGVTGALSHLGLMSPGCYLCGLVGGLLRARDALLVFKLSVLCDQLILLIGSYTLGRQLFARHSTAVFVSAGTMCSTVWYFQVLFNFRIYYALPIVLHFLFGFYQGSAHSTSGWPSSSPWSSWWATRSISPSSGSSCSSSYRSRP